jgi:hypothetical protein
LMACAVDDFSFDDQDGKKKGREEKRRKKERETQTARLAKKSLRDFSMKGPSFCISLLILGDLTCFFQSSAYSTR